MDDDKRRAWKQFELKKRSKGIKRGAKRVEGATVRHARRFLVNRWDKIRDVRLHIILWLGGVGFLIALVGLQMMWFQRAYITTAPVDGGTYAEAVKGSIQTLNPLFATTPAEQSASHLLFSSLYANDTTGHLHGDIATSMSNENDKIFTVKLRRDARWSDGQTLDADDVVFTIGLMKNPAVRSVMTASWQGIDVRKLDTYTVQFILPAQYAAFPQALSFAILPQHLLRSVDPASMRESGFSSAPVGSGPFSLRLLQIISQAADRKIAHLDANKDYYAGRPRVDKFQLHAYKDDDGIARALRTGEVTAASDVSGDVANSVDTKRYDVTVRPLSSGVYALFNMNQPLLKDPSIRKALQMVTDTSAIRKQLYGKPNALYLPFVNGQVSGTETIPEPIHSTEAAAKLLSDNGWTMKGDVRTKGTDKLQLKIVTRKNGDYEAALRVIAGQWRNLGVQVETQVFDTTDASQSFTQDILRPRDYDVLIDELVIGGDPDVFAYWHSRGLLNFSNYGNVTSDDALTSARTRSDSALRAVKYTAFARQWLSDAPAIGLYQSDFIYVDSKSTHAIEPNESILTADEHYADVRYWTANEGSVYKTP